MKKQLVIAVAAATMAAGSLTAQAYEQGDIIMRAGIVTVAPNADSDPINPAGPGRHAARTVWTSTTIRRFPLSAPG
jgi:outer membrane protein W